MRLIDADKLWKATTTSIDECEDFLELIEKQPTADRQQGKWIYGEDGYGIDGYKCDKCGFFVPWDYTRMFINYIKDYNYCPCCGARMEGK